MKISELITELEKAKAQYGDHHVTTYDGFISRIKFTPARDGICYPLAKGAQNEISIDIFTRDEIEGE